MEIRSGIITSLRIIAWVIVFALCQFIAAVMTVKGAGPGKTMFICYTLPCVLGAVLIEKVKLIWIWVTIHVVIVYIFIFIPAVSKFGTTDFADPGASFFGVANAVVLLGGIWLIWRDRD